MDLKQIEKMMVAMGRNGVRRMVIKQEGFEIELEKEGGKVAYAPPPPEPAYRPHIEEKAPTPPAAAKEGKFITSPMVGTFYAAPSPDDPAYIKVGDSVDASTVVCIIEAMKVMNEVKAGASGTVAEILLKNGDPVEFGTKLIRLT